MRFLSVLFFLFIISSCSFKGSSIIEIDYEKDLIPEGIAIHGETGKIYLSSVHKHKIVEYDLRTKKATDFIKTNEKGYRTGVGMTIKGNQLFTLSSETIAGKSRSRLLVFDVSDKTLLHKYELKDTTSHFMNDLAISEDNQIYITDTDKHRIYRLNYPEGQIEIFLEDPQIQYPNGITISDKQDKLFVDSWTEGIRIVDIATKKILNEKNQGTAEIGIDGLKYYKGNLYAIRNSGDDPTNHGLIKIVLNEEESAVQSVNPLLLGHEKMNLPTTFCIENGMIYMIANSQMDNLNQEINKILEYNKLTNTFILTYQL